MSDLRSSDIRFLVIACALALVMALASGCRHGRDDRAGLESARAVAPKANDADVALAAEVSRRLEADEETRAHEIAVTAADGVVTLRGHVVSDAQKDRAAKLADEVGGVERVENLLDVGGTAPAPSLDLGTAPAPSGVVSVTEIG